MDEKKKSKLKIMAVQLHQVQNLANEDGNFNGTPHGSFSAKPTSGNPGYSLEPHPVGVAVKRNAEDKHGIVIGSANIKAFSFREE